MGGGSHYPDSEIDGRPNVGSWKQHRDHDFQRNSHHGDMHSSANSVPTGAQDGRGQGSRGMTNEIHGMGQRHGMDVKDSDGHNGTDLATLREKRAELKAHLRSFSHLTPKETTGEHAEAEVFLMESEGDIIGLVRGDRTNSKPCHRVRNDRDSMGFGRHQSCAGGRIQQGTLGY